MLHVFVIKWYLKLTEHQWNWDVPLMLYYQIIHKSCTGMCISVSDENKKAVVHPEAYSVQYTPIPCFLGQQEVTVRYLVFLCCHYCVTASKSKLVHWFARPTLHHKVKKFVVFHRKLWVIEHVWWHLYYLHMVCRMFHFSFDSVYHTVSPPSVQHPQPAPHFKILKAVNM
jgi:hypothetical protein